MVKQNKISIGLFSRKTQLSKKALRIYDEKGLLIPRKNIINNYRYYDSNQFNTAFLIKKLVSYKTPLKEVKYYLSLEQKKDKEQQEKFLKDKLKNLDSEIEKINIAKTNLLDDIKNLYNKKKKMKYEIIEKQVPEQRIISIKAKGKYETIIPKLFAELCGYISNEENQRNHIEMVGAPILLCYDKEYNENATMEVAIPIIGQIKDTEKIKCRKLPAQKMLTTLHKGAYNKVTKAYMTIVEYASKNNIKIQEPPSRELYLNDPKEISEEELLTEIQIPIN